MALLKQPQLLILDEPTNGLDPAGIRWMRELVPEIVRSGCTVVVASHRVEEVEQSCDHVVVMHHGRCAHQTSLRSLIDGVDGDYYVGVSVDADQAQQVLQARGFVVRLSGEGLTVRANAARLAEISTVLASERIPLIELRRSSRPLDDVLAGLLERAEGVTVGTSR